MKIGVMTVAWNEERMIPWFLRHYGAFADEIVVFDHESEDKTRQLVMACPKARVREYKTKGSHSALVHSKLKSEFYRTQSWDWSIVVDVDEFVYHPNIRALLESYVSKGITLPRIQGWEMIGQGFPEDDGKAQIWEKIKEGVREGSLGDKPCVVHKTVVMNYGVGSHGSTSSAGGKVVYSPEAEIKMLHYKWVDLSWTIRRDLEKQSRLPEHDKRMGWGVRSEGMLRDYYAGYMRRKALCV